MSTAAERRQFYMQKYEENKEIVDARIEKGIEENRKGDCKIRFVDEEGKPVAGKKVTITQKKHDFKYGANIFMLDEFEKEEDNIAFRKLFAEHFNLATVPFYWNTLEPEEGKPRYAADSEKIYRRPAPDLCMQYCEENGITPKLHCLHYDKFTPDWLKDADEETIKAKLEKRFQEISERYSGKMFEFEVINELFVVAERKTVLGGKRDIANWCFETARKYFPNDKLTINEANQLPNIAKMDYYSPYFLQLDSLLKQGVPIDRIGIQNHQFTGASAKTPEERDRRFFYDAEIYSDPMMYFKALDILAELGKPLELTEVTVPTMGDTLEDEELQADILKMWLSVWFAHPAVDAVIYWNMFEGYCYQAGNWNENACKGGLWRHDLTPKKSAIMFKKLFSEIWHTDLELTTDNNGYVDFRGFYGEYVAEVEDCKLAFGLHKGSDNCNLEMSVQ